MAVTDEEKESIKASVFADSEGFRGALLDSLKHDDVQKSVCAAMLKGAWLWVLVFIFPALVWVARSIPPIGDFF
ncbi:MAG: hypothetical protein OXB96_01130 [Candidatus Kaiserbacteria bacterium]|nr:hypothetical protein [Candidatus Kaiserbacteria bacterium]